MDPANSRYANKTILPPAFNLVSIALILFMAGLGVAYWLNDYVPENSESLPSVYAPPLIAKELAGSSMQIPKSWLNPLTQNTRKEVQVIDLSLLISITNQEKPSPFNLRISKISQAQPSAYLLNDAYVPRFSEKQINDIKGLVGKPLKAEDGYAGETVWYEPVSANPFVAKCIDLQGNSTALNCLRTIRLNSKLSLTYQFSQNNLEYWQKIDKVITPLMKQIGIFLE